MSRHDDAMRHLPISFLLLLPLSELPPSQAQAAGAPELRAAAPADPSVAFYYASELPAAALCQFDQVVVQADQAEPAQVALLRRRGTTVLAYVSLSEVSPAAAASSDARFRLGSNPSWQTAIMDATQL